MAGGVMIMCSACGHEHMSDARCPLSDDIEPREECVPDEDDAFDLMGECLDMGLGDEEDNGHQVAPEEMQTIMVPSADPDDIRRWPRYSIPRRSSAGRDYLALYNPNLTGRHRLRAFTPEDYTAYLRAINRQDPDIQNSATWGGSERLTLTVSSLQTRGSATALEFSASSGNRWEFEIFNLDNSQRKWREIIRKRLMALPIQHLRITHLKTIFLDFIVGTNRMGGSGGVGTGGANWTYGTTVADANKLAGIGMTYSALNRSWGDRRRFADSFLPDSDDAIDQAFDDRGIPIFTIYHEFGHLFLNTTRRREDYSSQEAYQAENNLLQEIRANQALFDQYREAIRYEGQSQGWGEGFAEAYRLWMQNAPLGGGQSGSDVQALLLRLGFPTRASVGSAISAINRSAGGS